MGAWAIATGRGGGRAARRRQAGRAVAANGPPRSGGRVPRGLLRRSIAAGLAALWAWAAAGESPAPLEPLSPETFLDIAEGRTLTFADASGALVGVERFLEDRRTVWMRADGTCAYGRVTVRGPEVCFDYDDDGPGEGPHCWWPLREGSDLLVRLADASREEVQRITEITDEPVACAAAPSV